MPKVRLTEYARANKKSLNINIPNPEYPKNQDATPIVGLVAMGTHPELGEVEEFDIPEKHMKVVAPYLKGHTGFNAWLELVK